MKKIWENTKSYNEFIQKSSNMKYFYQNLFIYLSLLLLMSCNNQKKEGNQSSEKQKTSTVVSVPSFSADSAYLYIKEQVDFEVRVPNTLGHTRCANYLEKKLKSFGAVTIVQKASVTAFDGTELNIKNIIGIFNPNAKTRVLLFAHWDTRPWADNDPKSSNHRKAILGANDGASGVGVLLEIARQIGIKSTNVGVDIIFFDAEDYGASSSLHPSVNSQDTWCLGSQYWARNKHKAGYHAKYGILLDMVGAKNATFYREQFSESFAKHIVDKIWIEAESLGFAKYFINEPSSWITDDHYYVNDIAGIPSVDIIQYKKGSETGFFEHWHTLDDTMKHIDKKTLNAVGTTILNMIYKEKD